MSASESKKKFEWNGSDTKSQMAYNCIIQGPEEVDTDMKRMSGIAVDCKGTSTNGKVKELTDRTIWFTPGIGLVRIRESTGSTAGSSELLLSLKSYKVQ